MHKRHKQNQTELKVCKQNAEICMLFKTPEWQSLNSDGTRRQTSDIVQLTSPNVPFTLVGQDKMSELHLSEKDTGVH